MSEHKHISTADGSSSLYLEGLDETYHSRHGAIQESRHVFIENGLLRCLPCTGPLRIFEMGFGTGLNALLTWGAAVYHDLKVEYHAIEKYPIPIELASELNYGTLLNEREKFSRLHEAAWEQSIELDAGFRLTKARGDLDDVVLPPLSDIVYYDAFGPRVQPNMWSVEKLGKVSSVLRPGGILVTYCAQGQFRRNLRFLGFSVETLPGPPGKREMTLATKNS